MKDVNIHSKTAILVDGGFYRRRAQAVSYTHLREDLAPCGARIMKKKKFIS